MGRMQTGHMEGYWDQRANEDPFHYVDNRQPFGAPDVAAFWTGGDEVVDYLLDTLGLRLTGSESVVDIGCGIGRLTRALAARTAFVHALDVSPQMLALARSHNPQLHNVRWVQGDGVSLAPLPSGAFDACLSFVVFQHIPDPEITLGYVREMGRVLVPGGWAAFQVSNDPNVHQVPVVTRLRHQLRALRGRAPQGQFDPAWMGSAVTIAGLRQAAQDAELELEQIKDEGRQFCLVLARRKG